MFDKGHDWNIKTFYSLSLNVNIEIDREERWAWLTDDGQQINSSINKIISV